MAGLGEEEEEEKLPDRAVKFHLCSGYENRAAKPPPHPKSREGTGNGPSQEQGAAPPHLETLHMEANPRNSQELCLAPQNGMCCPGWAEFWDAEGSQHAPSTGRQIHPSPEGTSNIQLQDNSNKDS